MKFNITLTPTLNGNVSDRVQHILTDFDMKPEHAKEHFTGEIDIDGREWSIGAIVGSSGSGKSTIARELFKDKGYVGDFTYSAASVIDDMPAHTSVEEIEMAFSSVGFSSPPSWLKPYSVLSTGEKMRADLARAILLKEEMVVFDEFTSVVDRNVAKTASLALQKSIRKQGRKFVAVSCHKDILDWLMPDWIYDTDQKSFFGLGADIQSPKSNLTYTELITNIKQHCGTYLGSITI